MYEAFPCQAGLCLANNLCQPGRVREQNANPLCGRCEPGLFEVLHSRRGAGGMRSVFDDASFALSLRSKVACASSALTSTTTAS